MSILKNVEFYNVAGKLMYLLNGEGTYKALEEASKEAIEYLEMQIMEFYPDAYSALQSEYRKFDYQPSVKRFRVVSRFCKCNLGIADDVEDIDSEGRLHLEFIPCPIRDECKWAGVICRPKFNNRLSPAEEKVLNLYAEGLTMPEIAEKLILSVSTVNNHIHNAYRRLGIHSKSEFTRWYYSNNCKL